MTRKTLCRLLGLLLLAAAAGFFLYALSHPEGSFPWPNAVTYSLYALYLAVTAMLLGKGFGRS